MRLELGSPVRCAGERFGELADVVIDPTKRRVTHLVVTPRQRYRPARLVPIELVQAEHDAISLRLGHVEGFLVDSDLALTHVVLERGHLFGRRDVTIPIDAVARVATDSVALGLTKDEVGRLPAARVRR